MLLYTSDSTVLIVASILFSFILILEYDDIMVWKMNGL